MKRIADALERIAICLESMQAAQKKQIEEQQLAPDKIKELTKELTSFVSGGMKRGN